MNYAPHQDLIAPARRYPQIWRLVLGVTLIVAIYVLLILGWSAAEMALGRTATFAGDLGTSPDSALMILASFICLYPGLALATRLLHRRRWTGLFGPPRAALRDARRAITAALAVYAVGLLLPGPEGVTPQENLPVGTWAMYLLPALVALFVQVTAEEVLFRGYLQSQIAARFRSPLVWLVLPAVTFGLLHYAPSEAGANAPWLVLPAIAFGLVAADLTARCGNLGPAIGLHFLNNFAAILIMAPGLSLSGLALYRLPIDMDDAAMLDQLPVELALVFIVWLAARLALRR